MKRLYASTSGYLSVPIKSICSRKCASPGRSSGLLTDPIPTASAAAALSVCGSEIKRTRILLGSLNQAYSRLSLGLLMGAIACELLMSGAIVSAWSTRSNDRINNRVFIRDVVPFSVLVIWQGSFHASSQYTAIRYYICFSGKNSFD